MPNNHPFFDAAVEVGEAIFKAKKEAIKSPGPEFGMQDATAAQVRQSLLKGTPEFRTKEFERLKGEMGPERFSRFLKALVREGAGQ